jgi:hypothetical protein
MLLPSVTEKVTTPVGNETGKHQVDGEVSPTTSPVHLPPLTSNNTARGKRGHASRAPAETPKTRTWHTAC